jgi:hypothetical protein
MEWDRIVKPIKEVLHMKGCFRIDSSWENKFIMFCLSKEEYTMLPVMISTFD